MLIQLPNTDVAVNPRYVTNIQAKEEYEDRYGTTHEACIVVHWTYGVQQGQKSIYNMTLEEVVKLLNQ